jgi:DHA2 family multidrug resistance protein
LLLTLFPESKKGTALAIWSMTTLVAPVCGPILGGYISDNYHWSWIFLINVPVGLFCALICWNFLKAHETTTRRLTIDRVGLALLIVWVGALQIMLDQGKDLDWFSNPTIVALAVVAVIGVVAWVFWEQGERNPIVDLSLFKSRNFTLGTLAMCLGYAVYFGNVVLIPLWLQTQLAYTATWAGLVAAPTGVVALLVAPLVGRFVARTDVRMLATLSFVVFALSSFMRAYTYTADSSFGVFVIPLLVQGVALGLFFVPLLTLLLDGLPADRVPAASGLTNFLRITGGSFATSLTTTFWARREALHQSHMVESLSAYDPRYAGALAQLHSHGLGDAAPAAMLHQVVNQSYLLSTLDIFYFSGWLVLLLIPICWLARRTKGAAVAAGAE